MIGFALAAPAHAQVSDPDWPCVQRLVGRLEPGQMWSGPPLPQADAATPELQELVRRLIDPKTPLDEVSAKVAAYRDGLPPGEREMQLARLFALSLDWINDERDTVIRGIKRYARGQQGLADRIVAETRAIDGLEAETAPDSVKLEELRSARAWDTRIYTDRQKALALVCDQPVQLEQRAFALARAVQEQLQ